MWLCWGKINKLDLIWRKCFFSKNVRKEINFIDNDVEVDHCAMPAAAAALEDLLRIDPVILDLDPVRSRIERQFKDMENEEAGDSSVAMSLVDALQRWADALEAQASLTGSVLVAQQS